MITKIKNKIYTERYYIFALLIGICVLLVGLLVATLKNTNTSNPIFPIRIVIGVCGIWAFYFWAYFKIVKKNKDKFLLVEPFAKNFYKKLYFWFDAFFFICFYIIIIIQFLIYHNFSDLITGLLGATIFLFMVRGLSRLYFRHFK